MRKELDKIKKELMKPDWTENLHHSLEYLNEEDAKEIVESMSDSEIDQKVNNRRFQEDYIADYLLYLWEISKPSFWKQIKATIDKNEGLLWGADMMHFEKLTRNEIPSDVLDAVLDFAFNNENLWNQDEEAIFCVIKSQIERFGKLNEVTSFIKTLSPNLIDAANQKIKEVLSKECNYLFY